MKSRVWMNKWGSRCLCRCFGAAVLCLSLLPAHAQTHVSSESLSGPGSLSGVWMSRTLTMNAGVQLASGRVAERDRVVRTLDGGLPPMLPWAQQLLEQRIQMSQRGEPFVSMLDLCLPGMPAMMLGGPYPMQILETPGQVTILLEEQNHFRLIHLNEKLPDDPDPTFLGHSVGKWQGDTLVVDTIGLTDWTIIDRIGMPHSADMRITERFRRASKDTLELEITINDARTFTKPWSTKVIYQPTPPQVKMTEYICSNNRDYADAIRPEYSVPDSK